MPKIDGPTTAREILILYKKELEE